MKEPVPIVVLAGTLGAGKTTVLNHVLRHSADTRVGAIVNDFGDVDVDGLLVAGQADMMFAASGGCLCCATDDGMIAEFLDRLTRPRAGIDVVVLEASGVAEPHVLVHRVLTSIAEGPLAGRARFGGLVLLVDAEHTTPADLAPESAYARHLALADLVVLTKADRVAAERLRALRDAVHTLVPGRPTTTARLGAIDPSLLFDLRHEPSRQLTLGDIHAGEHTHHQAPYRTVSWQAATPLHPRRLADVLGGALPSAFRVKGFVTIDVPGTPARWTVHRVGRHVRLVPGVPAGAVRGTASSLVLIGPELDGSAYDVLAAVVQKPGEQADLDDLTAFERYVPGRLRTPRPEVAGPLEVAEPAVEEEAGRADEESA